MYNLHAHTFLSDGDLLPSEVAVRYQDKGYKVIAITDHADYSNIKQVARAIVEFCKRWPTIRFGDVNTNESMTGDGLLGHTPGHCDMAHNFQDGPLVE